MSSEDISNRIEEFKTGEAIQEIEINKLIKFMVAIDNISFESHIDKQIARFGIEKTLTQLLFPFLSRIGILWQTGHINPAQEHLITNITRQKLLVGIDKIAPVFTRKKTFILFLPEREFHEIGLLFAYYLLKKHGVEVCYLGTNVPINDVSFVADIKKTDYLYLHLTVPPQTYTTEKFLRMLSANFSKRKIIISGYMTIKYHKPLPKNIQFIKSPTDLVSFISTL